MKKLIIGLAAGAMLIFGQSIAAQSGVEAQGQAAAQQEATVEGKVLEVSPEILTMSPNPGLFFQQIKLQVNSDTRFEAISSLKDLQKGDQIKVEYFEQNGQKIASHIARISENETRG